MIVREVKCKSLLNPSKLAVYCINPYVGCQHGCTYCYADSITRKFSKHSEKWGEFVDVKLNAPEVLRKEIRKKKKGSVFISSLTDAYQPVEKKYELTRKLLEILLENDFPVCIQTKSPLVIRDLDLLKKFGECEVGFTIITLDESLKNFFEPFSPSVKERIDALRELNENGVRTYLFAGPLLPFISESSLEGLVEVACETKSTLWFDKLNLKAGVWERVSEALQSYEPEMIPKWEEVLLSKNDYYRKLKERVVKLCGEKGVECKICF
ncbi:MAG: radical SAM protein [Candidatus Micrarchaeia archaeon]